MSREIINKHISKLYPNL